MVTVAMNTDLKVCPHCHKDIIVRVSSNIGLAFHWVGDYFLVDVVLIFSKALPMAVLYREAYKKV